MATEPVYELTVYEEDDTTVLFTVGTDPEHARPYLKVPPSFPEQEIDFAKSSASISQLTLHVVDPPTDPTDQGTGYITSQLPDADGYSQLTGHRAVLTEDRGSGAETVLDGVVRAVRLLDSFAAYEFELRDIRERERKTRAFTHTDTPTVLPRGVLNGYGVSIPTGPFFGGSIRVPIRETQPLAGVYRQRAASWGEVDLSGASVDARRMTDAMREALDSTAQRGGGLQAGIIIFDRFKVLWRPTGSGSYTELTELVYTSPSLVLGRKAWTSTTPGIITSFRIDNHLNGQSLPTNGQSIDVIVQYDGPVTEDWPLHIQDTTVGAFIKACYDGTYSDENPRIRYDESALLALDTPIRARITAPADDLRAWLEKHAWPIAHAAPTLDADGVLSPATYLLPDENETLPHLDNDNCRPAGGGWDQGSEDTINVVRVVYKRDYASDDPEARQAGDTITSREVVVEHRVEESVALHGERVLTVESDLLTALGSVDGAARGDQQDEIGHHVARRITRMATDRFVLGGQYFQLLADRSDSDVSGLKAGSWVTVGVSWMPDYLSGERGLSRLAQVVSRRNQDAAWCLLTLVDAGSANAPLFPPTLGTVTSDADGVVSIPVTALGSEARIDYAVADTEPAADSGDWTFLDRVDSLTTVQTAPQTPGATVWVRARSELPGRRPSLYTTAVDVAIPETPRLLEVRLSLSDTGVPTVDWVPNEFCAGVEIEYDHHRQDEAPTFGGASVEADAGDFEAEVDIVVGRERVFSVRVTPYDGWTGAAVSGDDGPPVEASIVRPQAITAAELVESARGWNTDIAFSASEPNQAEWGSGSLVLADGIEHSISAGSTAAYAAATTAYVYWDPEVSETEFQDTDVFADAVGERKLLIAVVRTVGASGEGNATVIPLHGVAQWNGEHIVADSITADQIFGTTLSAIFADLGIIRAGRIDNAETDPTAGVRISGDYSKPATWQKYIDLAATGSDPFIQHPAFQLLANGDLRLVSSLDNLIRNPGFEQSSTDLAPWTEIGSQGTWSVSTTDPRSGLRCLTFDPSGMSGDARIENGQQGSRWEAAEGDKFYFSARAEGNGTGPFNQAQLRIYFRQSDGTVISNAASDSTSLTTDYRQIEVTGTAPAGTAQVGFELRVRNDGNPGIIKFDDCYARRMVDTTLIAGTIIARVLSGEEVELRADNGDVRAKLVIGGPTGADLVIVDESGFGHLLITGGALKIGQRLGLLSGVPIVHDDRLDIYGGDSDPSTDDPAISVNYNDVIEVPTLGFYGTTPSIKPVISGSRGGNAALASLLTQLAGIGLVTDSTSS